MPSQSKTCFRIILSLVLCAYLTSGCSESATERRRKELEHQKALADIELDKKLDKKAQERKLPVESNDRADQLAQQSQLKAQINAARSTINALETPIGLYYLDMGEYPPNLESFHQRPPGVVNSEKWAGPYLAKEVPRDPWERPYQYAYPGHHRPEEYDIWSLGPDGADGTDDDIGNWH